MIYMHIDMYLHMYLYTCTYTYSQAAEAPELAVTTMLKYYIVGLLVQMAKVTVLKTALAISNPAITP